MGHMEKSKNEASSKHQCKEAIKECINGTVNIQWDYCQEKKKNGTLHNMEQKNDAEDFF